MSSSRGLCAQHAKRWRATTHQFEDAELAALNPRTLFSEKHKTSTRFTACVRYPQGLRAFFRHSSLLRAGIRILDAGCGTGAFAVHQAVARRGLRPGCLHAFDLTPVMLERLRQVLETLKITDVEARQANVLNMGALPAAWANYDLIVTASMLECVPRHRLSDALGALRTRLSNSGRLVVFITKRNWLTRLLVGWWWKSEVYTKGELLYEFERAGFSQVRFEAFPLTVRYLAIWGYVVEASK
jgi:2-polyprenyl-3-methyl-5-hydroxy-6-metoxy-1,4-benzoquinol methylase